MTKREIVEGWLQWLRDSIAGTIENVENEELDSMRDDEIDIDFIIHGLKESIEMDLGKFERGIRREVSKGNK
jgi:hypothetical protein